MSILDRSGGAFTLTGQVDDIARGEDIRSVRSDGSRGYVVTFKKTDSGISSSDSSQPEAR